MLSPEEQGAYNMYKIMFAPAPTIPQQLSVYGFDLSINYNGIVVWARVFKSHCDQIDAFDIDMIPVLKHYNLIKGWEKVTTFIKNNLLTANKRKDLIKLFDTAISEQFLLNECNFC